MANGEWRMANGEWRMAKNNFGFANYVLMSRRDYLFVEKDKKLGYAP